MKSPEFSHKTPHLKGKQHQLDPNLGLKQLVRHATIQYVDWDNDGDVDEYDKKPKLVPDENPTANFGSTSKKLIAKQKGEIKHTKRGLAYEEKTNGRCQAGHYYCYTNKKCKPIPPGFMVDPEGMLRKENGASVDESKSGDSSLHDWFSKSRASDGTPGWVQLGGKYAGKPCAKQPGQTTKPKCGSSKMKRNLDKGEEESAFRRKNQQDPNPNRRGAAINVKTESHVSGHPAEKLGAVTAIPQDEQKAARERLLAKTKAIRDKKKMKEEKDHEYSMARSEIKTISNAAKRLQKKMGKKGEGNLEAWVQSKITKAADYIDTAADYVTNEAAGEKDACYSKVKSRYSVWPSAYASGALVKCRKVGAKNWGNKTKKEGYDFSNWRDELKLTEYEFINLITPDPLNPTKGVGSDLIDEAGKKCWPGYKKTGTQKLFGKTYNRCVKKESTSIEEATRLQSQTGNVVMITLSWRGKYYSLKMFFPQVKIPNRKEINNELQKIYPGSTVVYHSVSELQLGQPLIQAFGPQGGSSASPGPSKKYVKPYGEQVEFDEDWQKVNRQDKTDGLSQAAVNAYRRENPGSKLQTAVTEKNPTGKRAGRRKNFCSRMKGMKSKLTSAKTARDPNSRINKALRRWNCN